MKYTKQILTVVIVLCMSLFVYSQEIKTPNASRVKAQDSVKVSKHSPTAAILWSIIPGGGQFYNKNTGKCLSSMAFWRHRATFSPSMPPT